MREAWCTGVGSAAPELAGLHDECELGIHTLKVLLLLAHNMRIVWSQQKKE